MAETTTPDRNAILAELYKRGRQGELSEQQQAILGEMTRRGLFPPQEGVTEPGLVDVTLFVPGSEHVAPVLQHPAVLPTAGSLAFGPVVGTLGGEMLRQTTLPPSRQAPNPAPDMPQIPGLTPLAQAAGAAALEPGILPAMATGGALRYVTDAPGLVPALTRTGAGATAGTAAEMGRKTAKGEPITTKGVVLDAATNLIAQGAPELGTEALRFMGRHTQGGQKILTEAGADRSKNLGERVFQPPPLQEIANQFEIVRQSGVQIQPYALRSYLNNLSPDDQKALLREVKQIAAGPDLPQGLGQRLATTLEQVMQGQHAAGIDIGDLQQLRSQLLKRAGKITEGAKQDLLSDFKDAVDIAIDSGRIVGGQNAPDVVKLLHTARKNYALSRASEDLDSLVVKHSTNLQDLSGETLNLAALKKDLDTGTSRLAQSVSSSLQRNKEAQKELDAWLAETAKLYPRVRIEPAGGVLGLAQHALTAAMMSDTGRSMLKGFLADGNGVITANQLAVLMTMLSHQQLMRQRQPQSQ